MVSGLSVSDVVQVSITLTPLPIPRRNFGALLIVGNSDVIDVNERIRLYSTLDEVATDFGTTAPEYKAADYFFSQNPQPSILYIGRYASGGSSGLLYGGALTAAQQLLSQWTGITNGSFHIVVDNVAHDVTGLNFSAVTTMTGVAGVINTAVAAYATCTWDSTNNRFKIESLSTGSSSAVSFATATGSGTDISEQAKLAADASGSVVNGIAAETLVSCFTTMANVSNDWYGVMVAQSAPNFADNNPAAITAAALFIEGASPSRIFGVRTGDANTLISTDSSSVASQLQALNLSRTFVQYSATSYAEASMYGRAFTVDFTANNSTITLKFKQEPGIAAETLTESQAAALKAKNCNVFVNYNNSAAIIQEGVMCNGDFFDERHNCDWLQNAVQTDLFNLFYTSPTKIPQTDPGVHQLVTTVEKTLSQAVFNGMLAPGVWDSTLEFGQLRQGDTLAKGYYVFAPPVSTQAQADRAARKSPTLQVAAKMAGAIHFANVTISVNR